MKVGNTVVIYGSYGYTGQLIVTECLKQGIHLILSGRNRGKLEEQSKATRYPYEVVEISEKEKLKELLLPATCVIHCGGPFLFTAKKMAEACLATETHYTDITGEIAVFELLKKMDGVAREKGIMILPGTGFDVVPTDCLARHLKERLPGATNLELAFATSGGGASRGTTKTALIGLGEGSRVRSGGKIIAVPLHEGIKEIDFGPFKSIAARIPWGDVSTAHFSSNIPNIEVYLAVNSRLKRIIQLTRYFNWLLSSRWIKKLLLKRADKIFGPSESRRSAGRSFVKGRAWNDNSEVASFLETPDGYSFTAEASVKIVQKILAGDFKTGYQTPSTAYGSKLVLECTGVVRKDL